MLEANPDYREDFFPEAPSNADAATKALAATMKGKRLPQIGIIDIAIIEESSPRLLAFDRGESDLYGPSAGAENLARFRNSDFDALFRQSRHVADPEERTNVYAKMTDIVAAYNPWCPLAFRISNTVIAPWVSGYKKNVYYFIHPWHYLDIDVWQQKVRK